MISLTNKMRNVVQTGVQDEAQYYVDPKNLTHVTQLLRNMYSQPWLAVIREYSANAMDAHMLAGCPEKPIQIALPTHLTPDLKIRDFGTGLDVEQTKALLYGYGSSGDHKRQSNAYIGGLGIGSKSAFSVSNSFTFTIWHEGVKRIWNCFLDESDNGKASMLYEGEDKNSPSGIEVCVPVKLDDVDKVSELARACFQWVAIPPEIVNGAAAYRMSKPLHSVRLDFVVGTTIMAADINIYDKAPMPGGTVGESPVIVVMGGIPYPVQLSAEVLGTELYSRLREFPICSRYEATRPTIALFLPIGAIQIAPDRENLQYSQRTKNVLTHLLKELFSDAQMQKELDALDGSSFEELAGRMQALSNIYRGGNLILFGQKLPKNSRFVIPSAYGAKGIAHRIFSEGYGKNESERAGYFAQCQLRVVNHTNHSRYRRLSGINYAIEDRNDAVHSGLYGRLLRNCNPSILIACDSLGQLESIRAQMAEDRLRSIDQMDTGLVFVPRVLSALKAKTGWEDKEFDVRNDKSQIRKLKCFADPILWNSYNSYRNEDVEEHALHIFAYVKGSKAYHPKFHSTLTEAGVYELSVTDFLTPQTEVPKEFWEQKREMSARYVSQHRRSYSAGTASTYKCAVAGSKFVRLKDGTKHASVATYSTLWDKVPAKEITGEELVVPLWGYKTVAFADNAMGADGTLDPAKLDYLINSTDLEQLIKLLINEKAQTHFFKGKKLVGLNKADWGDRDRYKLTPFHMYLRKYIHDWLNARENGHDQFEFLVMVAGSDKELLETARHNVGIAPRLVMRFAHCVHKFLEDKNSEKLVSESDRKGMFRWAKAALDVAKWREEAADEFEAMLAVIRYCLGVASNDDPKQPWFAGFPDSEQRAEEASQAIERRTADASDTVVDDNLRDLGKAVLKLLKWQSIGDFVEGVLYHFPHLIFAEQMIPGTPQHTRTRYSSEWSLVHKRAALRLCVMQAPVEDPFKIPEDLLAFLVRGMLLLGPCTLDHSRKLKTQTREDEEDAE